MKKSQIKPKDLLKDIDTILNNIELLGKKDLNEEEINIIKSKITKNSKIIKNKYKEHLNTKDYEKEKEEILKFGKEAKDEIKNFKSNLDSLK